MSQAGDSTVEQLLKDLNEGGDEERRRAILELARLGPSAAAAVPVLLHIAEQTENAKLSSMAVTALGQMGTAAEFAVERLASMLLKYREHLFGRTIARALGNLGGNAKGALPALRSAANTRHGLVNKEARKAIDAIEKAASAN